MNSLSFRAQKATRQLDQMSKEFTEPIESWFWPKVIKEPTEETDIDLEEPKIKDVTNETEEQVNAEDNLQGIRYENDFFSSHYFSNPATNLWQLIEHKLLFCNGDFIYCRYFDLPSILFQYM